MINREKQKRSQTTRVKEGIREWRGKGETKWNILASFQIRLNVATQGLDLSAQTNINVIFQQNQ